MKKIITESMGKMQKIPPFLKWAGGKRWLVEQHKGLLDIKFDRYI
jgi:site-specific DNA-adenine methylase